MHRSSAFSVRTAVACQGLSGLAVAFTGEEHVSPPLQSSSVAQRTPSVSVSARLWLLRTQARLASSENETHDEKRGELELAGVFCECRWLALAAACVP